MCDFVAAFNSFVQDLLLAGAGFLICFLCHKLGSCLETVVLGTVVGAHHEVVE